MFQIPTSDPGYLPTAQAFEITLKSEELLIDKDLTIDGGGQTIEIQRPPVFGGAKFRIFHITAGNVTLSHLNIVHGDAADSADPTGGGIHNSGNLTVRDCNVLFNDGANSGGGLNNAAGSALVDRCMFFGNHANNGAAIINFAALTVTNSTFSGNETVAGNGGAINNSGTSLTVSNCTISANTSGGTGGGIATGGSAPHVANSIIAANTTKNGATSVDVFGPFTSDGYNFIGVVNDQTSGFGNPGSHDQTGSNATPANAMLGPLQDNGGFTQTMKPRNSSPLIDKGNSTGTTVDQRGAPRPVDRSGVANIGDGSDIGALEKGQEQWPKSGNTLTVTNLAEHDDIECTMDDCTLREAIEIGNFLVANASTGPMTIGFAHGLSGVIPNTQVSTGLQLTQALTIQGPGARVLTVSGSGTRVFDISTSAVVTISGLTISDGFVTQGNGGAITNSGELTLQDCLIYKSVVTGNDPAGFGGGIYSAKGATLTLNRCTVLSNTAGSYGGGVYTDGVFNATNCTFYDNSGLRGGGIIARAAAPTMTLHNCTITGNTATDGVNTPGFGGGGVYGEGGAQQHFAANCIISANKSTNDSDLRGNWTTQGHNLITNKGDSAGFSDGVSGDIVGLAAGLDSFGNNGGPTDTWSLLSTSPAVNKGDNNLAPATDQRRYKRSGTSDIGAFEFGGVAPTPTPTPKPTPTPTASPTPTPTASPSATPTATSTPTPSSQLQNLSTRKQVGAGSNVLIGGFIVAGTDDKKVLLRGLGPSLPVNAALADPILELHASDTKLLAVNDNWRSASNANQIAAILPPGKDAESAILTTLSAKPVAQGGAGYTGVLAGKGGTTGIGLLEIYDLATAAKSKLANISTRGFVGTGDDLLIGGFIPGPSGRLPVKVLVRALGPSLTAQGVSGALQNPLLELHDANGILLKNDNWKDASNAAEIKATLPPPDDHESAIITTLAPSNAGYTAVVRGANNSTGVALVEVYALH